MVVTVGTIRCLAVDFSLPGLCSNGVSALLCLWLNALVCPPFVSAHHAVSVLKLRVNAVLSVSFAVLRLAQAKKNLGATFYEPAKVTCGVRIVLLEGVLCSLRLFARLR